MNNKKRISPYFAQEVDGIRIHLGTLLEYDIIFRKAVMK
jgi:hypothetical protein